MFGNGPGLLMSFESAKDIQRDQEDGIPFGLKYAERAGATVIVVLSLEDTWFRSEAVFDFFDGLTDEDVFEDFDHVTFFGAGPGGYAAAAYSVSAPGADVLLISPQATLSSTYAEWDPRFYSARRIGFDGRYGYAPEMIEAARNTLVLYNPENEFDAMHAALFARHGAERFRCRYLGRNLATALEDMNVLDTCLTQALAGDLSAAGFARAYRARRDHPPYLRALLREVSDQDRSLMMEWVCRNTLARRPMPIMRKTLQRLQERREDAQQVAE